MGLIVDGEQKPLIGLGFATVDDIHCFYCGGGPVREGLYWTGSGMNSDDVVEIVLHHWCWLSLATRLFRDAHEYEVTHSVNGG